MMPRLPPVLLAMLGGASIYGIKYVLDRFEQKAIGAPGTNYDKVIRHRQNVRRLGIAAAVSGVVFTGYLVYEHVKERESPSSVHTQENQAEFYQDQYRVNEKRLQKEKMALDSQQRVKEMEMQQKKKTV